MKPHVKRAVETLEALGFEDCATDYEGKARKRVYVHPWHPDEQPIRLYELGSEAACTAASAMAHKIVELVTAGPKSPETIRERHASQRQREAREQSERLEAERRRAGQGRARMSKQELEASAVRELSKADRDALIREDNKTRFIEHLMGARDRVHRKRRSGHSAFSGKRRLDETLDQILAGFIFTPHVVKRIVQRGILITEVADTLTCPDLSPIPGDTPGSMVYVRADVLVVANWTTKEVITAYRPTLKQLNALGITPSVLTPWQRSDPAFAA